MSAPSEQAKAHSPQAIAAYPDDLNDPKYGPSSSFTNDAKRAAFDRGRVSGLADGWDEGAKWMSGYVDWHGEMPDLNSENPYRKESPNV